MNNATTAERKNNPNELARSQIALMPSLAGQEPRTAFHLDLVVLADMKGCGMHTRQPEPIVGLFKETP